MNKRRRMVGFVTSDKMDKTVIVQVKRTYQHRLYKKTVHSYHKVKAHDEMGSRVGDQVVVVESKPISATKRWVVQEILRRSSIAEEAVEVEQEA